MTSKPAYQKLELQPIAGTWREGRSGRHLDVTDPYTGEALLSLPMATREDLDERKLNGLQWDLRVGGRSCAGPSRSLMSARTRLSAG